MSDFELPVISLFSGAGGLDLAIQRAADEYGAAHNPSINPAKVVVATDYDEEALRTLSANMPHSTTHLGDIRLTQTAELLDMGGLSVGDATLVIGGPPCTPFSKSGFWIKEKRESRDPNASLLDEYVRVVREARPEAFILENVQGLTYKTHQVQLERTLSSMRELGYNPQWKVLIAADYGVPQLRRRVFIVGRRDGGTFKFPEPTHSGWSERDRKVDSTKLPYVTSREALAGLEDARSEPDELVTGVFGRLAAEVPPGRNYLWHTSRYGGQDAFEWRSRYWTFLLRLDPDRPSTTLQAQPGPWVGPFHWENGRGEDGLEYARRLRIPEILRLMSFPDEFRLVGSRIESQRQLGNAVPVELGKVVARSLLAQLGYAAYEESGKTQRSGQLEIEMAVSK